MFSDNYVAMCAKRNEYPTIVAEKIGYSRATGGKWANGSTPRPVALEKLAAYFDCTVEDLLKDEEKPAATTGNGLTGEKLAWSTAWDNATPEARQAALSVLMLGAQQREDQDAAPSKS